MPLRSQQQAPPPLPYPDLLRCRRRGVAHTHPRKLLTILAGWVIATFAVAGIGQAQSEARISGPIEIPEGTSATYTVTLDPPADRELSIGITMDFMSAFDKVQFSQRTVTFQSGDSRRSFTISHPIDDNEVNDYIRIFLAPVPAGVSYLQRKQNIKLRDRSFSLVSFDQPNYEVGEGGSVDITVMLSSPASETLVIPLATDPASGDFRLSAPSMTVAPARRSASVTLTAVKDDDWTGETVTLSFASLPAGLSVGRVPSTTVQINDLDAPPRPSPPPPPPPPPRWRVSFDSSHYTVQEGESVTVKLSLSRRAGHDYVIPISVDAESADSFELSPASVTIPKGERSASFKLTAKKDEDSDDETLLLSFGDLPPRVSEGDPSTAAVTIRDPDPEINPVTVDFEQEVYVVNEGDAATVTVRVSPAANRDLDIPLEASSDGGDFHLSAPSVTVPRGRRGGSVTITAPRDQDASDDDVTLSFGALPRGVTVGNPGRAMVRILDSTFAVSFGKSAYYLTEGTAMAIEVNLDRAANQDVVVPVVAIPTDGSFSLSSPSVTIPSGGSASLILFEAPSDTDSDDESVVIALGELPPGIVPGPIPQATVNVTDTTPLPVSVSFEEPSYTAVEGGSGATVVVTLSAAVRRQLRVPIDGTPLEGTESDAFEIAGLDNGRIVFGIGETRQTLLVTALEDKGFDDGSVRLSFGEALPEAVTVAEPSTATVKLEDTDPVLKDLTVSFADREYLAEEGGREANIEVRLSEAADRTVTIPLRVTPQSGATSADYHVSPAQIAFSVGMQVASIKVVAIPDGLLDQGESVDLAFRELPDAVAAGQISMATVSLADRRTAQQVTRSLEALLAVVARTVAQSAQTAIVNRFDRKCFDRPSAGTGDSPASGASALAGEDPPSQDVARTVPFPDESEGAPARAAPVGESEGSYVLARGASRGATGAYRSQPTGMASGYPLSGVAYRAPSAGAGRRSFQAAHPSGPYQEAGPAIDSGRYSGRPDLLASSAFNLQLQDEAKGAKRCAAIWGYGDLQGFNGNLGRLGMNYSGTLLAGGAGVDLHVNDRALLGLSFMRSDATADYGADGIRGVFQHSINTFHPYLYVEPVERVGMWVIGGFGQGVADFREPGRGDSARTGFRMVSAGTRATLAKRGANRFGVRMDAFSVQLSTDEPIAGVSDSVSGEATRARVMLEADHQKELRGEKSLGLRAEFGARHDGGDADRGWGAEAGLRMGYANRRNGVDASLFGRTLVAHVSGYRDWGIGVQLAWDPGRKNRGLRMSVSPTRGRDRSGATSMWSMATPAGPLTTQSTAFRAEDRMEAWVGYGKDVLGRRGLMTSYSRFLFSEYRREMRLGTEFTELQELSFGLPLIVNAETIFLVGSNGRKERGMMIRMSVPF